MSGTSASVPERVVLVVIDLAGGGTQQVVAGLARALVEADSQVMIITNETADGRWGDLHVTADVVEIPGTVLVDSDSGSPDMMRNARWLLRGARTIRRALQSLTPDTPVLAFLPGTNALTSLARLGMKLPLVLCERNDISRQPLSLPLRVARRLSYRTATLVTTNRSDDLMALQALTGRVPVHLVSNPPPSVAGRAVPSVSRRILTVGRLTAHKRHRDAVLAFGALAEEFPDWTLRVLGDGPERSALERLVRDEGLDSCVEIFGWTSDPAREFTEGAILVHASEYEGTANAVLEAMGSGLPVVASGPSAPPPAATETEQELSGIRVFAAGDVPAITSHLRDLMNDAALRDELGAQAVRTVARVTADPVATWSSIILAARQRSDSLGRLKTSMVRGG